MSTFRDTNVNTAVEAAQIDALREAMITGLREMKAIRSDRVADAFDTMPRHQALDVLPEDARSA